MIPDWPETKSINPVTYFLSQLISMNASPDPELDKIDFQKPVYLQVALEGAYVVTRVHSRDQYAKAMGILAKQYRRQVVTLT